jgi:hypothetical protein
MRALTIAVCSVAIAVMSPSAHTADMLGPVPSLTLKKNSTTPSRLDMTWSDSCGLDQTDFAIYEGTIGSWTSHARKICSTGGATSTTNLIPQAPSSYYLVVAVSASQEGSYGKRSSGAEIPAGINPCRAVQSAEPCIWKRVFVSTVLYQGDLEGLAGADTKCQELAMGRNLGGTWKAFLSDSSQNAVSRLTHSIYSYRLLSGARIAQNDVGFFSTSHERPIDIGEDGVPVFDGEVWTGSSGSGVGTGGCANWTSTGGTFPAVGLTSLSDAGWANSYLNFCNAFGHLYCVEQ